VGYWSPAAIFGCLICAMALAAFPALGEQTEPDGDDEEGTRPLTEIVVTAQRLDVARAKIEPSLGASTYTLSNEAVEHRPSGETTNLNQILLQAPGVTQDGSGLLHVRSQSSPQYRINNIIMPEGLTDIGESLSARIADRVQLITGALPAQYGLQVGGIVNVTTKNGAYEEGGQAELYGGSHGEVQPAFEYAGSAGNTNIFVSGSYFGSDVGLSSPDGSAAPAHDHTDQGEGLAFLDHILDDQSRISLILGLSNERFQIPFAGNPLNAGGDQRGTSGFGILSYQRTGERFTLQLSGYARYSTFGLHPDGDSNFPDEFSQTAANSQLAGGLQVEGVYDVSDTHALRAGVSASAEREKTDVASLVLALSADAPESITTASNETRRTVSVFVQDEWKILDRVTLNAGLRFDDANLGGSALSPRINLVWNVIEDTTLHAGYGRYFVPPPLDGMIGATPALTGTTGAPPGTGADPLRAESDDYFDIGVEQKIAGLNVGVDGYWRNAANLIGYIPVSATTLTRPFNYAAGRVRGVELSGIYADGLFSAWANLAIAKAQGRRIVSNQFAFTAAELAYADGRFVHLGEDQTYTVSAGASYRWGAVQLSADLLYGSGLRRSLPGGTPNGDTLPGYVQANLAAVYHTLGLGGQPLDLRLDAINVFDRRYALRDGTAMGGGAPQWGPRRGFFVGIEQAF
jgi:outer membrane receptor protein involved in Fe transport